MATPTPEDADAAPVVAHYFIDEAGTPTLFAQRGRVIVGQEGCSLYFILGKLQVGDPAALEAALGELRARLLADPLVNTVPSLLPEAGKTAEIFHAKDDIPEVRYEVFRILAQHDVKFSAVVRDKLALVAQVQARNQAEPLYRYNENELYDELVSQLFKTSFHQADHFELAFASRGASDRSQALEQALQNARRIYEQSFGVPAQHTVQVIHSSPRQHACLQAVDYFLWALQRLYERREDRYWNFVWPKVRVVHDLDDRRQHSFGEIYTPQKPLTKDALPEQPP